MSGQTNGGVFNPKNLSLFSYTYNNPVNLVDPDGNRVFDFWVRSRAPFDNFGFGYHGDGDSATFNADISASSRLFFLTQIDTEAGTASYTVAGSFGTTNSSGEQSVANPSRFAKAEKGTASGASTVVGFGYSGGNPDLPSPDIDVMGQLRLSDQKNGNLHIQGEVYGDGFPSTSAFAHFKDSKVGVMLGSSSISKGTNKNTGPTQLIGGANKKIMNINMSIGFKGNDPVSVTDWNTGRTHSVSDWNSMHNNQPMVDK